MSRSFFLLSALILLAGCATPSGNYGSKGIAEEINRLLREPYSDTQSIDIIYATNRMPSGDASDCGDGAYGLQPTGKTSYGVCRVNVPKRHNVGAYELAGNPQADPHRFFRVLSHVPLDEPKLKALIESRKPADMLMYVHGFNVKFGDAVLRAAQLAYDLKFQGPVMIFTWPAGAGSLLDAALITRTYESNRANAKVSSGQLSGVFKQIAATGIRTHLIVHSMGHQVVLPALERSAPDISRKFIGELILNAPDFPLKSLQALMPAMRSLSQHITLYCSYNDNAIAVSEIWNKGRRVGACEQVEGADVLNVGEIDAPALGIGSLGHGYYASRPILTDIFQLLIGVPADRRLFVRKSEPNSVENYFLRP